MSYKSRGFTRLKKTIQYRYFSRALVSWCKYLERKRAHMPDMHSAVWSLISFSLCSILMERLWPWFCALTLLDSHSKCLLSTLIHFHNKSPSTLSCSDPLPLLSTQLCAGSSKSHLTITNSSSILSIPLSYSFHFFFPS